MLLMMLAILLMLVTLAMLMLMILAMLMLMATLVWQWWLFCWWEELRVRVRVFSSVYTCTRRPRDSHAHKLGCHCPGRHDLIHQIRPS
jgi:hypothetical protein